MQHTSPGSRDFTSLKAKKALLPISGRALGIPQGSFLIPPPAGERFRGMRFVPFPRVFPMGSCQLYTVAAGRVTPRQGLIILQYLSNLLPSAAPSVSSAHLEPTELKSLPLYIFQRGSKVRQTGKPVIGGPHQDICEGEKRKMTLTVRVTTDANHDFAFLEV